MRTTLKEFIESQLFYHGTASVFSRFEQSKSRVPNDYYGGGVAYFTSDKKVAITYAKSAARQTPERVGRVYTCKLKIKNTFDVDSKFSGKELLNLLPKDLESFARGANLLSLNTPIYSIIGKLKTGNIELSGDQIFRGLSQGMVQTKKAREYLKSKGFDSLRYNGGINMNAKEHDVYIVYDSNDIEILKRQKLELKKS